MREKRSFVVTLGIAVLALAACGDPMPSSGGDLLWTLQFGTSEADQGAAVAVADDGRIAVAGETRGDLGGPSQGGKDAFVRLLDGDRAVVWTRQFGSPVDDVVQGLAFHPGGGLVVAGLTYGDLGGANTGGYDAFVRRLDTDGQAAWTHQFGSIAHDVIDALAIDADGRVVVAGTTRGVLQGTGFGTGDAFVRQLEAGGGHRWTRQFGSAGEDFALGVAAGPGGRVAVGGGTGGDLADPGAAPLGHHDAFVQVFDADGDVLWTHQFGTDLDDHVFSVAFAADGRLFAFGVTDGALAAPNAGERDVFVRAYGPAGEVLWAHQFGSAGSDYASGVAVAASDDVVVDGTTTGALAGDSAGDSDAYVARLGPTGAITWIRQFGTAAAEHTGGVAIGSAGEALVVGTTGGALVGASSGGDDAFLRAYGP
jgi:hypothetical protein